MYGFCSHPLQQPCVSIAPHTVLFGTPEKPAAVAINQARVAIDLHTVATAGALWCGTILASLNGGIDVHNEEVHNDREQDTCATDVNCITACVAFFCYPTPCQRPTASVPSERHASVSSEPCTEAELDEQEECSEQETYTLELQWTRRHGRADLPL